MTEPLTCDSPRFVSRRDEEEPNASLAPPKETKAAVDWQSVPTMSDANTLEAAKTAGASTNAARTTERNVEDGPYAAVGKTHDGGSVFAGVALMKGRSARGVEVEVMSVSGQVGEQEEVQAALVRLGHTDSILSSSAEVLTASAHRGIDNSDGSRGRNLGVQATLIGAEVTAKRHGSSFTTGVSIGVGVEAHIGVRDDDKDGRIEFCARASVGFVTSGFCIERPVFIRP